MGILLNKKKRLARCGARASDCGIWDADLDTGEIPGVWDQPGWETSQVRPCLKRTKQNGALGIEVEEGDWLENPLGNGYFDSGREVEKKCTTVHSDEGDL